MSLTPADPILATGAWPRLQPVPEPDRAERRLLVLLNLFRIGFAGLLLGLSWIAVVGHLELPVQPPFPSLLGVQLALGGLWMLTLLRRQPRLEVQAWLQLGLDLPWICALILATGGLGSGLGLVLLLSCVGAGLVMPSRQALTYAALASFHILGLALIAQWYGSGTVAWPHAGLLGAAAFGATWGANVLTRRANDSTRFANRAGRELADLARLNEVIIDRLLSGVLVVSPRGRVRLANAQARDILGPALRGTDLASLSPDLERLWTRWRVLPLEGTPLFQAGESKREYVIHFTPLGQEGAMTLITLEDLGQSKARMQEMKLSALGRLTAGIAHEIRNPLSAISHAAALLGESTALDAQNQSLVEIVRHHAGRINGIITDILQLSRQRPSTPEILPLADWLDTFIAHYGEGLDPNEALIDLQLPPLDLHVRMDPGHLSQVLTNLLDNARRHGQPAQGPVRIEIGCERIPGSGRIHLHVTDNGPGIAPDAAARLFEPFFTTSRSGTGLGLYLSRELCEFNDASLAQVAHAGTGCRFRIALPDADFKKD
ncbi:MAG: ATP-binding protein [Candidatus Macondimonas sp.]|jgi:two-component system sensor histidine kinase PilS (NtrC family)